MARRNAERVKGAAEVSRRLEAGVVQEGEGGDGSDMGGKTIEWFWGGGRNGVDCV
jgi:hypothetical protein